jgi:polyisoprenoid-binding protein YceI
MPTTTYRIDKMHARIGFAVRHLVISTVRGHFNDFDAEVTGDEADPATARVTVSIRTASVDTGVPDRDNHLRSDDFFNAEQYPEITFASTSVTPRGGSRWTLAGDLTIRDVTRPLELDCEVQGPVDTPMGRRFGVNAEATIDRLEYGLKYNPALETGGLVVGAEAKLSIEAEFVQATGS